jgi:hypothetical protein
VAHAAVPSRHGADMFMFARLVWLGLFHSVVQYLTFFFPFPRLPGCSVTYTVCLAAHMHSFSHS